MRTAISASSGAKRDEVGLGADDGEGALIDRGAVAEIVLGLSIDGLAAFR